MSEILRQAQDDNEGGVADDGVCVALRMSAGVALGVTTGAWRWHDKGTGCTRGAI